MIAFLEEEVDNRKPHFHLISVGALLVSNDPLTTDQLSRSLQELASTEVCSEVRSAIRLLNTPVHQTHRLVVWSTEKEYQRSENLIALRSTISLIQND
jgi:hypothetical protein